MVDRRIFAATEIVEANEILSNDSILAENITYKKLSFATTLDCIKWLAKRKLLHNSVACSICHVQMSFVTRTPSTDGYRWQCKQCRKTASIRSDSFFSKSHLALEKITTIIYGWTKDYTQETIADEAEINRSSPHTLADWCSFCRAVCEQHLIDYPMVVGGLNEDFSSKVVEIVEPKFFHRKSHRGERREGHWVFGGVERETGNCFIVEVPDGSQETLFSIIERFILPGTMIISDGWKAYRNLSALGGGVYEHDVIIRDAAVHTQNIENLWMRAKKKLQRQLGTSEAVFASSLYEFVWRNKYRDTNQFGNFLICIREQYPL